MIKNIKKRAILLLVICLALISSFAYSLDAPHSPANLQDCATCHDFSSSNPYLMTDWTGGYTMQDDDDTPLNHLCRSCHYGGGSAPAHDTHSYLGVGYSSSTASPYGGWQVRCSTCHNPHYQDQAKAYIKTGDTYWKVKLIVGTVISSATSSTIQASVNPAWATNAYVGMHVIPDVNTKYPVSYKITANTSDTLTVKGPLNPATGLPGKTFAIFRGKLIRNQIKLNDIVNQEVSQTGRMTVRFFNASGTKSFADGDTTYDGICEVCHNQTSHFRNSGSAPDQNHTLLGSGIPGQNCTGACHVSSDGFQPSGCSSCHGYPVDTGSLISLDKTGASATSDSQGPGAHIAHNTKFECTNCHTGGMIGGASQGDDLINIGFYLNSNLGGNYDGTASRTVFNYVGSASTTVTTLGTLQCSNLYCHSTGQSSNGASPIPSSYAAPAWNGTAVCGTCHAKAEGEGLTSGSHGAHLGTAGVNGCADCHTGAANDASTYNSANHVNRLIDVANTYGAAGAPGNGYGTCSAASCHSNVYTSGTIATPVWGSTDNGCSACHTTVIDATGPATGGHALHAETTCTLCHNAGTTSATMPSTEHADGDIDTNNVGYSDNKAKGSIYTTCSTASCHANVYASGTIPTPIWGSTGNGCSACHTPAIDPTGPATGSHSAHMSATVKVNGSSIVCVNCHNAGTTSATKPSTEHADGDIDTSASLGYTDNKAKGSAPTTCSTAYCHTNGQDASGTTITQKVTATWGTPATCTTCHDFNGSMQPTTANHTTHITRTGGTCVQCHDVYGDNTTEPDLNSPLHINNVINVAQGGVVTFGYDGNGSGNHAPGYGYGSCSTVSCHGGGATRTWGQMGDACEDCHSNLGGPSGSDRGHGFHVQTAYIGAITASSYGDYTGNDWYAYSNTGGTPDMGCGFCHPQSDATHNNGVVNLNFDPSDTGASATLKFKNDASSTYAQTERTSVTCSSVYCHSDGYANPGYGYQTSPEWFLGNFVGDKCDDCHGNSPASNSHDSHVVGIHYEGVYTGSTGLASAGSGNTNAHGSSSYSTTISCSTCHNSTVTQTANAGNNTCTICHTDTNSPATGNEFAVIYASATTHINGTPDIAFNAINVKSKAQLRDNTQIITDLDETWVRSGAYKVPGSYDLANNALNTAIMFDRVSSTCSTVACHNGNSVKWGDTGISCNNCHTDIPNLN